MKRIKAGCMLQTIVFMQKENCGIDRDEQLARNREDVEKYKKELERKNVRCHILDAAEQADGSIVIHVRRQLDNKTDISDY